MNRTALLGISLALAFACAAWPEPASANKTHQVQVEYVQPKNAAHQALHQSLKQKRVLEQLQHFLQVVRLPERLTLKFDGCEGESDAFYDAPKRTVTLCYELIADLEAGAPKETTSAGVTPQDAVLGPMLQILLHETGHALFHILKLPILGREEDAADQVAAYMLLQFGKETALQAIRGAAYMYARGAGEKPDREALAAVHSLSAQRFYNVVCLAYGADPALFAGVVEKGYLPYERADGCRDEYLQVDHAVRSLIGPHIDTGLAVKRRAEWRSWRPPPRSAPPPPTKNKNSWWRK